MTSILKTMHTPGPWHWWDESTDRPKKYDLCRLLGKDDEQIFSSYGGAGDDALGTSMTARANARLIAAAPEMLEALKAMEAWTAHAFDADDPDMDLPELEQARAAIAKATGQQVPA